jgi:hypothetical protein
VVQEKDELLAWAAAEPAELRERDAAVQSDELRVLGALQRAEVQEQDVAAERD